MKDKKTDREKDRHRQTEKHTGKQTYGQKDKLYNTRSFSVYV